MLSRMTSSRAMPLAYASTAGAVAATLFACRRPLETKASSDEPKTAFDAKEWREFPITDITQVTHDTKRFRCALPSQEHQTGMTTASCILVMGEDRVGKAGVVRPYTPTTTNDTKGHFDLVIKNYPQGNVSSYVHGLKVGDKIKVKGPLLKIKYEPNMKKEIGMISGGSGITPMLQWLQEVAANANDKTKVTLLYVNRTPGDILVKAELDALAKKHPNIKVIYKVDQPTNSWKGGVGHITLDDIHAHMPAPGKDALVFVCGPPGLMNVVSGDKAKDKSQGELTGLLKDAGFKESMVYKF